MFQFLQQFKKRQKKQKKQNAKEKEAGSVRLKRKTTKTFCHISQSNGQNSRDNVIFLNTSGLLDASGPVFESENGKKIKAFLRDFSKKNRVVLIEKGGSCYSCLFLTSKNEVYCFKIDEKRKVTKVSDVVRPLLLPESRQRVPIVDIVNAGKGGLNLFLFEDGIVCDWVSYRFGDSCLRKKLSIIQPLGEDKYQVKKLSKAAMSSDDYTETVAMLSFCGKKMWFYSVGLYSDPECFQMDFEEKFGDIDDVKCVEPKVFILLNVNAEAIFCAYSNRTKKYNIYQQFANVLSIWADGSRRFFIKKQNRTTELYQRQTRYGGVIFYESKLFLDCGLNVHEIFFTDKIAKKDFLVTKEGDLYRVDYQFHTWFEVDFMEKTHLLPDIKCMLSLKDSFFKKQSFKEKLFERQKTGTCADVKIKFSMF